MELHPPAHFPGEVPDPRKGLEECQSPPSACLCVLALGLQVAKEVRMFSGREDGGLADREENSDCHCLGVLANTFLFRAH